MPRRGRRRTRNRPVEPIKNQIRHLSFGVFDDETIMVFGDLEGDNKVSATRHESNGIRLSLPGNRSFPIELNVDPAVFLSTALVKVLRDPDLTVCFLKFDADENEKDTLFRTLYNVMAAEMDHLIEINCLIFDVPITQDNLIHFLQFIKPNALQSIMFNIQNPPDQVPRLELDVVGRSEQWLQMKSLLAPEIIMDGPVEAFDHFEGACFCTSRDWGVEELDHIVKLLLDENHPASGRMIKGDFIQRNQEAFHQYFNQYTNRRHDNETLILVGNMCLCIEISEDLMKLDSKNSTMPDAPIGQEAAPNPQIESISFSFGRTTSTTIHKRVGEENELEMIATRTGVGLQILVPGTQRLVLSPEPIHPTVYMCSMLVALLREPNIQIHELDLATEHDRESLSEKDRFFRTFSDLMPPNQIELKKLRFAFPVTQNHILQILPFLKPGFLEELIIYVNNEAGDVVEPLELDAVSRSEQWLQLKEFRTLEVKLSASVEAFDHFEKIDFCIASDWGVEEIDHIVKLFRNRRVKKRHITGDFIRQKQDLINQYFKQYRTFFESGTYRTILMGPKFLTIDMTEESIYFFRN